MTIQCGKCGSKSVKIDNFGECTQMVCWCGNRQEIDKPHPIPERAFIVDGRRWEPEAGELHVDENLIGKQTNIGRQVKAA